MFYFVIKLRKSDSIIIYTIIIIGLNIEIYLVGIIIGNCVSQASQLTNLMLYQRDSLLSLSKQYPKRPKLTYRDIVSIIFKFALFSPEKSCSS